MRLAFCGVPCLRKFCLAHIFSWVGDICAVLFLVDEIFFDKSDAIFNRISFLFIDTTDKL